MHAHSKLLEFGDVSFSS
jgi:hypothetical protein